LLEKSSAAFKQLLEVHLHKLQFTGQGFHLFGLELLTGKYTVKELLQFFGLSKKLSEHRFVSGSIALKIVLCLQQMYFLA
jgi:hypothetical protein